MRKVKGEEITIKELKNCYFGYSDKVDFDKIVEVIECNGCYYSMTECGDAVIQYPIELDSDFFADYSKLSPEEEYNLTVYKFINNWWGLDDFDLEDFTFYFVE